jgi:CheY-like chemotaxis protein
LLCATIPTKISLHLNLSPDMPPVLADEAQVHQVVMNLITNAAEAIGARQGVITVATGMMEASEEYLAGCFPREPRTAGRYVFLEVADTGSGMDSTTRERIFEPFFTTKFTGRGLGLSAVQGIMRGHQGAVHVESAPGAGTRMRVLFPPAAEPLPVLAATAPPTRYHGRGATVLVIDDEAMVRNTLSAMLRSLGFVVLTAADGQEGVELFRTNRSRIAVVLLDMTMPRMNGEETFRELRRLQPNVRTILCSGYSEKEAADRFSGQGIAGFLQKPFGLDSISARLSEVLGGTVG